MKIIDCIQGSDEWYAAKCGVPSSSEFDKIITTSGEPSKQRQRYLYRLVGERILGKVEDTYQSAAMLRGKELESEGKQHYEFITEKKIKQVGFCVSSGYGASPDGLVGTPGLLEIKCPILATQVYYLLKNEFPKDYFQQTQGQMLVTGRSWVDFFSYYPGLQPLLIRVKRDNKFIKILEIALKIFCSDLNRMTNQLKKKGKSK